MIIDLRNESDVELARRALAGRVIGITSGGFDMFHDLHLDYLEQCRRQCEMLVVGIDSDTLLRQNKGEGRPVITERSRARIINALRCVHVTFIMGKVEDFGLAVEQLGAQVILKNDAFKEEEVLGRDKAKVVIIPDVVQLSSTSEIIEDILRRRGTVIREGK
jgi:D-beta-D-heptose 7-phosphate kinase/D-beta-D-heptose 1-phosphate adenosyltransferase